MLTTRDNPIQGLGGGGSSSRIKLAYMKHHEALMSDIMHENHSYGN